MKRELKLIEKVKRLLKRCGLPRWLHRMGPKRFLFWQHMLSLLVKAVCQLSYRRTNRLLSGLGYTVPTYSALAKMAKRLPLSLWQRLLAATRPNQVLVGALDSTTFARSKPSYHYMRRIDRISPSGKPVKLSILVDTRRKKVVAAQVRILPRHDTKDVPAILRSTAPHTLVADKGYDSEAVHELCHELSITSMIPSRRRVKKGFYRRKMAKKFRLRTYHRRELVEALFSSLKAKFGSTIRCRRARSIRSELFARFIAHNIGAPKPETFN